MPGDDGKPQKKRRKHGSNIQEVVKKSILFAAAISICLLFFIFCRISLSSSHTKNTSLSSGFGPKSPVVWSPHQASSTVLPPFHPCQSRLLQRPTRCSSPTALCGSCRSEKVGFGRPIVDFRREKMGDEEPTEMKLAFPEPSLNILSHP